MARVREVQHLASLAHGMRRVVRRPAADVRAATVVALRSGGEIVPHPLVADAPQHVAWDVASDCLAPFLLDQSGEGHFEASKGREAAWQPNRTLSMKLRCRRCVNCLRARRRLWAARAVLEWKTFFPLRTWFVTLTFNMEEREEVRKATMARVGLEWLTMTELQRFRELLRTISPLVTKWLHRVRKTGRFRYLLVAERHADGWPHFHALLHEVDELCPIRKDDIRDRWHHGFSKAVLVKDARQVSYVTKYLGKSADARVRASKFYGEEVAAEAGWQEQKF